jgi:glycosyltransferase involved in cell wall biosynthesis
MMTPLVPDQTAIYIPAYQASKTLPDVLDRIYKTIGQDGIDIVIVDNASTDGTSEAVNQYISEHGLKRIHLIRNPENLGYGGSQKVGYRWCIDRGYRYVAMVHSDGQYAPEYLPTLFTALSEGHAGMVFGSRIAGDPLAGGMPLHRYLGNKFLSFTQNLLLGLRLSEYHSGYRIYSTDVLRKIPFERLSNDYHFDTEVIILMLHYRQPITETAIPTKYGDEKNYVNIWKYGSDVLMTTVSYWLHRSRFRKSYNWARILELK